MFSFTAISFPVLLGFISLSRPSLTRPCTASLFLFTPPTLPSLVLPFFPPFLSCRALLPRGLSCLESFTFYCRIILSRLAQTQRFTTKSSSLVTLTQTPGLSPYTNPDPDPEPARTQTQQTLVCASNQQWCSSNEKASEICEYSWNS